MRASVRALLVDPADRVLLVAYAADDGGTFWGTVGGGVEPGEGAEQALRREVAEETGLVLTDVGVEVWHRRVAFTWRGEAFEQDERVWLVRVPAYAPSAAGWTPLEQEAIRELRWWSPAELAASGERFAPRGLPALLTALLRDGPPPAPLELDR